MNGQAELSTESVVLALPCKQDDDIAMLHDARKFSPADLGYLLVQIGETGHADHPAE